MEEDLKLPGLGSWETALQTNILPHLRRSDKQLLRLACSENGPVAGLNVTSLLLAEDSKRLPNINLQKSYPAATSLHIVADHTTSSLWHVRLSQFFTRNIHQLKRLEALRLENDRAIQGKDDSSARTLFSILQTLTSLRELYGGVYTAQPSDWSCLTPLTNLTRLELDHIPEGVHPIQNIASAATALQALSLKLSFTTRNDLCAISNLKQLQSLDLTAPAGEDALCPEVLQSWAPSLTALTHLALEAIDAGPMTGTSAEYKEFCRVQQEATALARQVDALRRSMDLLSRELAAESRMPRWLNDQWLQQLLGLDHQQLLQAHAEALQQLQPLDQKLRAVHRRSMQLSQQLSPLLPQLHQLQHERDALWQQIHNQLMAARNAREEAFGAAIPTGFPLLRSIEKWEADRPLQGLTALQHLTSLRFSPSANILKPDAEALQQLRQLRVLATRFLDAEDAAVLQHLPHLDDCSLRIERVSREQLLQQERIKLHGRLKTHQEALQALDLSNISTLEIVIPAENDDGDDDLLEVGMLVASCHIRFQLAACFSLQALRINKACVAALELPTQVLQGIAALPQLAFLCLDEVELSDVGSLAVGCAQLKVLTLAACRKRFSEADVRQLMGMPRLRTLRLLCCWRAPGLVACVALLPAQRRTELCVDVVEGGGVQASEMSRELLARWREVE